MNYPHKQRGGIVGGMFKLLIMLMLAYLVTRTGAHLDTKYQAPPPSGVTQPATPPTNKVK